LRRELILGTWSLCRSSVAPSEYSYIGLCRSFQSLKNELLKRFGLVIKKDVKLCCCFFSQIVEEKLCTIGNVSVLIVLTDCLFLKNHMQFDQKNNSFQDVRVQRIAKIIPPPKNYGEI